MRIALVSDAYTPQVSGVVTVLRRIVEVVRRAGHDAVVVAPEFPDSQPATGTGELRVPSVAFPPYPAVRLSLPRHRRVAQYVDDFGPDLVHVVTEGPLGFHGRHYALRRGLPLVTSYHTHFPQYCRHYGIPALEGAVWRFLTWFHRPARIIHTPGESACDALRHRGLAQASVWGRGVDTALFHPDRRSVAMRRRLGARVVLAVAGDGPWASHLYDRVSGLRKLGFLRPGELAQVYASADVCVFPSFTETCGLVALEAMASGTAVVAADAGGFPENLVHGRTGLLVDPHDAAAFARSIVRLALDPMSRHVLGATARRFALTRDRAAEDDDLLAQYAAVASAAEPSPTAAASGFAPDWRPVQEGALA